MSTRISEKMNGGNAASPSKRASSLSGNRAPRGRNWRVILAVGVAGIIVAGIALFTMVSTVPPHGSLQTTTVRPTEVIRVDRARPDEKIRADAVKPSPDSINVPPAQGTVRRMEGISKAFSKQ